MRASRWAALLIALVAVAAAGVALGAVPLHPADVIRALRGAGDPTTVTIVRSLRVPRVVLAMLVGAGLGASGGALQGSLRNALAEPYLLGVSGGAAVGAVLAVTLGAPPALVPLAAFVGAGGAIATGLAVAGAVRGRSDPRVLLMAGVIVGAFANAVIMVALANAPPNTVRGALWWMMGSVSDASWRGIGWLAAYLGVGFIALLAMARDIDVLALGEEPAAALGVHVERAGLRVFLVASLLAAATVAAAGLIGFVGLVVPHLARGLGVRRHRPLMVASALAGGTLVMAADLVARTVARPAELPLGAVTALIGVPFFLARLRRFA